jgi:hypothetical protein
MALGGFLTGVATRATAKAARAAAKAAKKKAEKEAKEKAAKEAKEKAEKVAQVSDEGSDVVEPTQSKQTGGGGKGKRTLSDYDITVSEHFNMKRTAWKDLTARERSKLRKEYRQLRIDKLEKATEGQTPKPKRSKIEETLRTSFPKEAGETADAYDNRIAGLKTERGSLIKQSKAEKRSEELRKQGIERPYQPGQVQRLSPAGLKLMETHRGALQILASLRQAAKAGKGTGAESSRYFEQDVMAKLIPKDEDLPPGMWDKLIDQDPQRLVNIMRGSIEPPTTRAQAAEVMLPQKGRVVDVKTKGEGRVFETISAVDVNELSKKFPKTTLKKALKALETAPESIKKAWVAAAKESVKGAPIPPPPTTGKIRPSASPRFNINEREVKIDGKIYTVISYTAKKRAITDRMKPRQWDARGRPLTAAGKRNQEIKKVNNRIKRYINKKNKIKTWPGQKAELDKINAEIVRLGITRKAKVKPGKAILDPSVKKERIRIKAQLEKVEKSKKISGSGAAKAKAKLEEDLANVEEKALPVHAGFGTARPPEMKKSGGRIGKKQGGEIKYYKKGGRLSKVSKKPRGVGVALRGYGKAMRHG